MKLLQTVAALSLLSTSSARFFEPGEDISAEEELYRIELTPGDIRWVTEDEKWALRREGKRFFDITESPSHHELPAISSTGYRAPAVFPAKMALQSTIHPLLSNLSQTRLRDTLTTFTTFHTRYYKSDYGRQSSEWLLGQVQEIIDNTEGAKELNIGVKAFPHSWGQSSIIATIPGRSNKTVVIGAHQDSINLWLPSVLAAPGADDDGSGTVTILEAFRVLLLSEGITGGAESNGKNKDSSKNVGPENTIEFHWYSAEEGGLLGSQAVFAEYAKQGREVRAMLQQDMTGYTQRTIGAGKPEVVGVITDFVDEGLTDFIKKVIEEYCDIAYTETKCGYACSDHASASKFGYPSAFVIESEFSMSDPHIHSTEDKIEYLSFPHMEQHARMTLALAYELGFTNFKKLDAEVAGWSDEL